MKNILWLIFTCGLLVSCGKKRTSQDTPENDFVNPFTDGFSENSISVYNQTRKYLVHRPEGLGKPNAVLVILHGGGGHGTDVANYGQHPLSMFRSVADANGLMAIYPEGSADIQGNPGWNDCRSDAPSGSSGSDLTFLKDLIAKLSQDLQVDNSKIFLVGASNGGVMAYAYAFNYPDSVRAIAVSSANLPENPKDGPCKSGPNVPIPLLVTLGTTDPAMPVNGGCVANLGGQCNRGKVISQQQTLDFWLNLNGLQGVTPKASVIEINDQDQGAADKITYSGSHPLVFYRLNGAGHPVPSISVKTEYSPNSGYQNRDIEFAEEVWGFFRSLPTTP